MLPEVVVPSNGQHENRGETTIRKRYHICWWEHRYLCHAHFK
jgi:ribosome-associated protein YbcJ (S4-like RNA binding protein)